ncbi:MAG: hypothetical protein KAH38_06060 [Candidatus Hydrogenedentes bacterium]|nr:hypothetical protein [Candidatus Hydrogenedentota bacterium]
MLRSLGTVPGNIESQRIRLLYSFNEADTDEDGQLTLEEVQAVASGLSLEQSESRAK